MAMNSNGSGSRHEFEKDIPFDDRLDNKTLTTITLSNEQFERLFQRPKGPSGSAFGNPTPLAIAFLLVAQMPLAMDLLNFRGATAASSLTLLGVFYTCGGFGLILTCIMEWIVGNTFPSVVFGTYGGFFLSYAILNQPSMGIAAAFAPADATSGITAAAAGAASQGYNVGLGLYFITFGIVTVCFFVASLRTNAVFASLLFCFIFVFGLIAAGYFHSAVGNLAAAPKEFKAAGAFSFLCSIIEIYAEFSVLLASVGFPYNLPLFDLSTRLMAPKSVADQA